MPQEPPLQVNGSAVPFHPIYDQNFVLQMTRPAVLLSTLPHDGLLDIVYTDNDEQATVLLKDRYRVMMCRVDLEGIPELTYRVRDEMAPVGYTEILVISSGDDQEATERWVTQDDYHFSRSHKGRDRA